MSTRPLVLGALALVLTACGQDPQEDIGSIEQATASVTRTWAGSTTSWNTSSNWSPAGVPAAGAALVFPTSPTFPGTLASPITDDVPSIAGSGLTYSFAGGGYYVSLGGQTVSLASAGIDATNGSGTNTIMGGSNGKLLLAGSAGTTTTIKQATGGTLTFDPDAVIGSNTNNQHVTFGASGYGGKIILGQAINSYSGDTTIASGTVQVNGDDSTTAGGPLGTLGLKLGSSIPLERATLDLNGHTFKSRTISINTNGPRVITSTAGSSTAAQIGIINQTAALSGITIEGAAGSRPSSGGYIEFTSNNSTYTGTTTIGGNGSVYLNAKDAAVSAPNGSVFGNANSMIVLGNGNGPGHIISSGSTLIRRAIRVNASSGTCVVQNISSAFPLSLTGAITANSSLDLLAASDDGNTGSTIQVNAMAGSGAIGIRSSGGTATTPRVKIGGQGSYNGTITVGTGTTLEAYAAGLPIAANVKLTSVSPPSNLLIDASISQTLKKLYGSGSINYSGKIANGANPNLKLETISPGDIDGSIGTLSVTGTTETSKTQLTTTYRVDVDGPDHDQLAITNTRLDITGAMLDLNVTNPPSGPLLIVSSTVDVTGTFKLMDGTVLAEGTIFDVGGAPWHITYKANGSGRYDATGHGIAIGPVKLLAGASPTGVGASQSMTVSVAFGDADGLGPFAIPNNFPSLSLAIASGGAGGAQLGQSPCTIGSCTALPILPESASGATQDFVWSASIDTDGTAYVLRATAVLAGIPTGTSHQTVTRTVAVDLDAFDVGLSLPSTTTSVTATPDPSVYGEPLTLCGTVTVDPPGTGTPTGNVTFTGAGQNATAVLDASGQGCATTAAAASGTVTAIYSGDASFASSAGMLAVTASEASTTTTLTATPAPSVSGESVTLCASVLAKAPGSGGPAGTVTLMGPGGWNQTVTMTSGQACTSTATLHAGTVTAMYNGEDPGFTASTGTITVAVNQAGSTTTVAAPDPSVTGESVTVCATVVTNAPGSGTPTGSVTFTGPQSLSQSITLNAGEACLTTSSLATGTVTATYGGDPAVAGSAGTVSVTVNQAATTTTATATPTPIVLGQSVMLCATVEAVLPGAGTLTGSVTFDGPNGLSLTSPLNGSGLACATTTALVTGSVSATYSGDIGFAASSGTVSATVSDASTTTVVAATPDPSIIGTSVTLCATSTINAPGSGTPTGTVTFTGPGDLNQAAPLDGSGQACVTSTRLATGTVTASYAGASGFGASAGTLTVTVMQDSTTNSVTTTPSPVYGQSVTMCSTVAASSLGSGTPTGTVTFTGAVTLTSPLDASAQACVTTSQLALGMNAMTSTYSGDLAHTGSADTFAVTVIQAATTSTVVSAPSSSLLGQTVTITVTVAPVSPGAGTPTGTVSFVDASSSLGSPVMLSGGVATLSTSSLTVGSHTLLATYSGDSNFTGSSGTDTAGVGTAVTTTTVTSAPSASVYGGTVAFTAAVTSVAPGTPSGTVTFSIDQNATAPVTLTGGSATYSASLMNAGAHSITAVYSGDGDFSTSDGTSSQTVDKAASSTALSAEPSPAPYGSPVTLTATVTAPGTIDGTVTFLVDLSPVGAVSVNGGVAVFVTTGLEPGTHNVQAVYSGSQDIDAANVAMASHTVVPAASDTTLVAYINPGFSGQDLSFRATIATDVETPDSGIVTFFVGADTLGTAAVKNGQADLVVTGGLAVGVYGITAVFGGTDRVASSASPELTQTITLSEATIHLTSAPNPAALGEAITLTATITAEASLPAGTTVQFLEGSDVVGTATTGGDGVATLQTSAFTSGQHTIHAEVAATATTTAARSEDQHQLIEAEETQTVLSASPSSTGYGETLTLSAAVNATGGQVTFSDGEMERGSVVLDQSGVATFTLATLAVGQHRITASYSGAGRFAGSQGTIDVVVATGATSTTLVSSQNPVMVGDSITLTATVSGAVTPTGTVQFFDGAEALGSAALDALGRATFTDGALAFGSHSLTARYSGDGTLASSVSTAVSEAVTSFAVFASIASSPNPSNSGEPVSFVVTLTDVTQHPEVSGDVVFRDAGTVVATIAVADGKATWVALRLTHGAHSITATYGGDTTHAAGATASVSQVVLAEPTAATVATPPPPATVGDPVTLMVEIKAIALPAKPVTAVPGGTVTFRLGNLVLGTAPVEDEDGKRVARLVTSAMPAGMSTVTASYSGDANFAPSTVDIEVALAKIAATAILTSSAPAVAPGEAVTFTVVISAARTDVMATGEIVFKAGTRDIGRAILGANGQATFTVRTLPAGSSSITAVYAGDSTVAGVTSAAVLQTVGAPTDGGGDGGCGCSTTRNDGTTRALMLLLLAAIVWIRRLSSHSSMTIRDLLVLSRSSASFQASSGGTGTSSPMESSALTSTSKQYSDEYEQKRSHDLPPRSMRPRRM